MYTLSSLKHGIQKPILAARELNRLCHSQLNRYDTNPAGESIFERDWDNLILLDACRFDYFREVSDLSGTLQQRTSLGSATYEFVPANFTDQRLHDVVYVTTNSWYTRLRDDIDAELHALIDLNHTDLDEDAYDPNFDIIKPSVVTEQAKQMAERYPNKRLIVHHNQPHYPYIGPFGRDRFDMPTHKLADVVRADDAPLSSLHEDIVRGYKENLVLILEEVEALAPDLTGKTVITADHGDMLGERHRFVPFRDYGHHDKIYNRYLTEVPWHVLPFDERKEIVAEPPIRGDEELDPEQTREALEALGYLG